MADAPIGITFLPTAAAAANGPKQAGIEGQGGSDLTQAFKILSLHLPRVLGAGAIAPKRLLTSPGSAGVAAPAGVSPYAQVFQALLQSIGGSMGGGGGADLGQSLSSLYGAPSAYGGFSPSSDTGGAYSPSGSAPPPNISTGIGEIYGAPAQPDNSAPAATPSYTGGYDNPDTRDTYNI